MFRVGACSGVVDILKEIQSLYFQHTRQRLDAQFAPLSVLTFLHLLSRVRCDLFCYAFFHPGMSMFACIYIFSGKLCRVANHTLSVCKLDDTYTIIVTFIRETMTVSRSRNFGG